MTTREVLVGARKLIEKPERWASAGPELLDGERHCALTAVMTVAPTLFLGERARSALQAQARDSVAHFNDTHSHAEILDLFDKAIEAA
jgi:hypothetical protein